MELMAPQTVRGAVVIAPGLQRLEQLAQSASAVGAPVLLFGGKLGAGHTELRYEQQRIVAEAPAASRLVGDHALEAAFGLGDHVAVGIGDAHGADEARAAALVRDALELPQQLLVVSSLARSEPETSAP